jgi:diguanylate cyclase (GGDEF)-like protein
MRAAVENLPTLYHEKEIGSVTISVGVAQRSPGSEFSCEHLLIAADAALYEAKRAGRNRVFAERSSSLHNCFRPLSYD